jgi:NADH-quinone oxidoreductase subunit M
LNGFIGEVLVLMGVFAHEWSVGQWPIYGVIASSGIILGAWYLMTMLRHVFFGPLQEPHVPAHEGDSPVGDMTFREVALSAPIAILCVAIGVHPQPILNATQRDVEIIAGIAQRARERADNPASGGRKPPEASGSLRPRLAQESADLREEAP